MPPPPLQPILPGAAIGILGGGQLGRMLALAARAMGYRVHVFSPEEDSPAGQVADRVTVAPYDDVGQVRAFATDVRVVTFEFENISSALAKAAEESTVVRPSGQVLQISQDRIREKTFLRTHGFPVPRFHVVRSLESLHEAGRAIGFPSVLKTATLGYDGKGQWKLDGEASVELAWRELAGREAILEEWIDSDKELSAIAARAPSGASAVFPLFHNRHVRHILDVSSTPAAVDPALVRQAEELALSIAHALELVGLLTVELFLRKDGQLCVNELAPRTHNSGHLTIEACVCSQFEQQVRAVCGLPLASVDLLRPAAMANLLGDLWSTGEPNWAAALADPGVKLHLYGKVEPRPGRKMGHLSALAGSADKAVERVTDARVRLTRT